MRWVYNEEKIEGGKYGETTRKIQRRV